jgi:hypothetical protein
MSTPNDDLASKVGADKPVQDPRKVYDGQHGSYDDQLPAMPLEKKLTIFPMQDEPSPFSVGNIGKP